jgi:hypothetical protein
VPEKATDSPGVHPPFHVRLPGFVNDQEVGLGDAIKRATYAVGVKPCSGCERRSEALNRLLVFSGGGRRKSTKGGS